MPTARLHNESFETFLTTHPLPQPKSKKLKFFPIFFRSFNAKVTISSTAVEWPFSMPMSLPFSAHSPKTSVAFRMLISNQQGTYFHFF